MLLQIAKLSQTYLALPMLTILAVRATLLLALAGLPAVLLRWAGLGGLLSGLQQPGAVQSAGLRAEQERLVVTLTSQLALSLANLQLRVSLQLLATHDPLTGLLNRRALDDALLRELRRARRSGRPCGVIMLDIDHFKRVNDTDGHSIGDLILQLIARQLIDHIRAEDIAYRYGGEEFVLLLPEAGPEETARRAEDLRGAVERLVIAQTGATVGGVTISLGVAAFPEHGESGPALLAAADTALYAAKRSGRNCVVSAVVSAATTNP